MGLLLAGTLNSTVARVELGFQLAVLSLGDLQRVPLVSKFLRLLISDEPNAVD